MKLVLGPRFKNNLGRFLRKNPRYVQKVARCLKLMEFDIYYPSLRLHKLVERDVYSVSVDMKIRIIVQIKGGYLYLLEIGNHDEVY